MARKPCVACNAKQAVRPGGLCNACFAQQHQGKPVPEFPVETIKLADVRLDDEVQARAAFNAAVAGQYAEAMTDGATFPPGVVFRDADGTNWLAAGWHRHAAHEIAGHETMDFQVRPGDREDAELYAIGDNSDHGMQRTADDKRRSVEKLLRKPKWASASTRQIAEKASVSSACVERVRRLWEAEHGSTGERIGLDGRDHSGQVKPTPDPNGSVADEVIAALKDFKDSLESDDESGAARASSALDVTCYDEPAEAGEPLTMKSAGVTEAVTDAYGAPVPDRIADVFEHDRREILANNLRLSACLREIKALRECPGGVKINLSAFTAAVENAKQLLKAAVPSCVCPVCGGTDETCEACEGRGWWWDARVASATNSQRRKIEAYRGTLPR